ncbi:hypothetical protein ADL22_30855 [Streptomyces sp. NRRL F-4489]|uniref:pPIWI_RE_Y domain-containing protein n=1 Tax=Streptomyces sp. NRRL F-4489 TaxID=1609095 RepID=UPI000749F752|nr:HU-CCDC81 and SPOR domain-containing protein [Streptomyces sp. NRRL F-4489]KUL34169.1 hypothetical protein ADL22_30855 [Streptomyces sp. NRRL F-4489]
MSSPPPPGADGPSGTDQDKDLFLGLADALTVLSEHNKLRSFSLPYPREAQLALDRVTLHCVNHGWAPPKSLPELMSWCTRRPAADPVFGVPPAPMTYDARWIDPVGLVPTRTCLEVAPLGQPGRAEQDALDALAGLAHRCGSADRYRRCRKFLAHHPVVTQEDRFAPGWSAVVWNTVRTLYEPLPEGLMERKLLAVCGTCGLPARTRDDEWESGPGTWCEGEVCPHGVRFRLLRRPGHCLVLRRSLRVFLAASSRTEQEALDELVRIGADYHLLENSGIGAYRVAGSGLRTCLIQAWDRRQPALMAGRAVTLFSHTTEPVLMVVPRRAMEQNGYRALFDGALSRECRGRVILTTADELERHLRPHDPLSNEKGEGAHA